MQHIVKAAGVAGGGTPTPEQLELIHRQTKTPLAAEELYVFSLRLCDDQPDRDGERFDTQALPALAKMLVGKTGLSDHRWDAERQVARIFDTTVEHEEGTSFIRAWVYLLRAYNQQLIDEIEGGIRREVSIGCAMKKRRCSICGAEMGSCAHEKGQVYSGQLCTAVLSEPADAYEFSFVAVPAQPRAGVMKRFGAEAGLEQAAREAGCWDEYRVMKSAAAMGRAQAQRRRGELVRLGMALELGLDRTLLERMAAALEPEDVEAVCRGWSRCMRALYPGQTQLDAVPEHGGDDEFRI